MHHSSRCVGSKHSSWGSASTSIAPSISSLAASKKLTVGPVWLTTASVSPARPSRADGDVMIPPGL
ncbi:Uncharacterised protein [Mycobacteroides abscessus subsp. abscessus]|nr:Uncharacterised protein [Mycobacteroides abscessus subsp. abscessus]